MNNKAVNMQNVMLVLMFVFTLVLAALILRPLVSTILTALIVGYIFYPVYRFLNLKIKNKTLAAIIVSVIIVLLITIPAFFIVNTLANEAYVMYTRTKQIISTGSMGTGICEGEDNLICNAAAKFNEIFADTKMRYHLEQGLARFTNSFITWAAGLALSIPIRILQGIVVLFILFYFFKDHKRVTDKLKLIVPLKSKYRKDIIKQVDNVTYAIVFGYIVVALLEGLVGVIGFRLFMPNSPYLFWGVVIAFLALIPLLGASVVWWPAIIIQLINAHFFLALGLAGCMIITFYIDTAVRARLVGDRADVHPVYVLLGVIGGVILLGVPGVVVGPLILALLNTFLKIFTENQKKISKG
ncbi:AI-2E family transporter [Candidatus Woesearchaeota archaeon]|nr:AI-2E family transporter [Candidatus Woesearchaeota archaeon]